MTAKVRAPKISEADVTKTVIDYLRSQHWMCIRHQSGLLVTNDKRRIRVGSPGAPDWIVFKGEKYCFIEMKAPGKVLTTDQLIWFGLASFNKINCIWCDSFQMFMEKWKAI